MEPIPGGIGNSRSGGTHCAGIRDFNGAYPRRDRKPPNGSKHPLSRGGFNGAYPPRDRKPKLSTRSTQGLDPLQWSLSPEG